MVISQMLYPCFGLEQKVETQEFTTTILLCPFLQPLNQEDLRKGKNDFQIKKNLLCDDDDEEDYSPQNGHTYQLYTLYRDKDGNIRQVTDFFFLKTYFKAVVMQVIRAEIINQKSPVH